MRQNPAMFQTVQLWSQQRRFFKLTGRSGHDEHPHEEAFCGDEPMSVQPHFMQALSPPAGRVVVIHSDDIGSCLATDGELWHRLEPTFRDADYLLAHNASFDRRVLRACENIGFGHSARTVR